MLRGVGGRRGRQLGPDVIPGEGGGWCDVTREVLEGRARAEVCSVAAAPPTWHGLQSDGEGRNEPRRLDKTSLTNSRRTETRSPDRGPRTAVYVTTSLISVITSRSSLHQPREPSCPTAQVSQCSPVPQTDHISSVDSFFLPTFIYLVQSNHSTQQCTFFYAVCPSILHQLLLVTYCLHCLILRVSLHYLRFLFILMLSN